MRKLREAYCLRTDRRTFDIVLFISHTGKEMTGSISVLQTM